MKTFAHLAKAIKDKNKTDEREAVEAIKNLKTVDELTSYDSRRGKKLTAANCKKPFLELQKILIEKTRKNFAKRLARDLSHVQTVASCTPCTSIKMEVTWTTGGAYGWQAFAELWTYQNYYKGKKTGGYGYDKESTATANALNLAPEVLFYLYDAENKRLRKVARGENISRRDFIGYGSGYGVIPYFEGGVGQSSINSILQKIGFAVEYYGGKTWNLMLAKRNTKKRK